MPRTNIFLMLGVALFLTVLAAIVFAFAPRLETLVIVPPNSFEECVAAGNPVMESYPERCRTPDGKTFENERQRSGESSAAPALLPPPDAEPVY